MESSSAHFSFGTYSWSCSDRYIYIHTRNAWVQRLHGRKGTLPSPLGAQLMKGRPSCIGINGADLRGGLLC